MALNNKTMRKIIALTFDDGPNTTTTLEVLDKLEKYNVRASFFLIGDYINEQSVEAVKRAYEMGCEIGNHSKTHSDMTKLSVEEIKAEIAFTSAKIKEIIGETPKFFRPPYIAVNEKMIDHIELPFICGIGARDWEDEVTVQERARLILDAVSDGNIILLHDLEGNRKTVEALDLIIPGLREAGYEFVTVSELFEAKGVKPTCNSGIVYSHTSQKSRYDA